MKMKTVIYSLRLGKWKSFPEFNEKFASSLGEKDLYNFLEI